MLHQWSNERRTLAFWGRDLLNLSTIGDDFVAMGKHYVYIKGDIVFSFAGLVVFALIMYAFAR